MTKDEFIKILNEKLKLIRTEFGFSQDKMSETLGISKKTLVQIEKGRSTLGWTGAVTLCTIFGKSDIVLMTLGGPPEDAIMALALDNTERQYSKTLGGNIWWIETESTQGFKLQKNIIFRHYRILDNDNRRICSSFEYENIKLRFKELTGHE